MIEVPKWCTMPEIPSCTCTDGTCESCREWFGMNTWADTLGDHPPMPRHYEDCPKCGDTLVLTHNCTEIAALRQFVQELDRAIWEEVESRPYPKDPWEHHLNGQLRDIRDELEDA